MFEFLESLWETITDTAPKSYENTQEVVKTDCFNEWGEYQNLDVEQVCTAYGQATDTSFLDAYGADAWMDSEGIIQNTEGKQPIEQPNSWMDGAGLYHNTQLDQQYANFMKDLDRQEQELKEQVENQGNQNLYANNDLDQRYADFMKDMDRQEQELKEQAESQRNQNQTADNDLDQRYVDFMKDMDRQEQELTEQQNEMRQPQSPYANPLLDQMYEQVMADSQVLVEQLEEQGRYNMEHGIMRPLYTGQVDNPYYNPAASLNLDGLFAMCEPASAPKYGMDSSDTLDSLKDDYTFHSNMAQSWRDRGMDRAASASELNADAAFEKFKEKL